MSCMYTYIPSLLVLPPTCIPSHPSRSSQSIKLSFLCSGQIAAAAKSLQSCPMLCDLRDGNPPGSPIPGILQARTLEWVAIAFSDRQIAGSHQLSILHMLVYICQSQSPNSSYTVPHSVSICLCLCSCPENWFICSIFLDVIYT